MVALFQTFYYVIHNRHKKTPMHIMNGQAIRETCKSSTLIRSFNHLGQCIGYDKVRRYHTDMATLTADKTAMMYQSQVTLILKPSQPLYFFIMKKRPYHDTVSVLFQDKPAYPSCKPNVSESSVIHGSKILNSGLHCKAIFQTSKETGCTIFL